MSMQKFVAAALVATAAASPVTLVSRQDNTCEGNEIDGQYLIAGVGYYSDKDCSDMIGYVCAHAQIDVVNAGPGEAACEPPLFPDGATTPFYAKMLNSYSYPNVELDFTQDQSCPPNGAGAIFATVINDQRCVQLSLAGDGPGLAVYPNGGGPVAKKVKRDTGCTGFNIDSQQPSESASVTVSNLIDCTTGGDSGCEIDVGQQHTESITTSYSVTAGGGIEGLFEASATFGMDYTDSETTSTQENYSVPGGQKGYLTAYSTATLFKGTFTGCNSGDAEQPGEALVIKTNGLAYEVTLTG